MIERRFLRVLDRSNILAGATEAARFKANPSPRVQEQFRQLFIDEGRTRVSRRPTGAGLPDALHIIQPRHEHVPESKWFPEDHFEFSVSPPSCAALGSAMRQGPDAVLGVLADAMYERTAAQLATLEVIASGVQADIVSSHLVAPLFHAVEVSNRGDADVPLYVSDASRLLAEMVLRHVGAVERLDDLTITEVMDLADHCAEARASFQARLDDFVDQVLGAENPEKTGRRLFAKKLKPELDAFEADFGTRIRTIKTYSKAALLNPGFLVSFPLAAVGAILNQGTLWSLASTAAATVAGVVGPTRSSRAKHKSWPTLFFSLRNRA